MKKHRGEYFVVVVYDPNFDKNMDMGGALESKIFISPTQADKYFVKMALSVGANAETLDSEVEKQGCYYNSVTGAIVQMDELAPSDL